MLINAPRQRVLPSPKPYTGGQGVWVRQFIGEFRALSLGLKRD